jgi:SAM-dependent methyltransferase
MQRLDDTVIPDQRELWDEWHGNHTNASHVAHADRARNAFLRALPHDRSCHVLELGCGQGRDATLLAAAGHVVYGVDWSSVAMQRSRRNATSSAIVLRLITQDYSGPLPFRAQQFDGIYAHLALHYFDDETARSVVNEMHRVLKPGGALYFTVRCVADILYGEGKPLGSDMFCRAGHIRRFFSDVSIKNLLCDWNIARIGEYVDYTKTTNPGHFLQVVAHRPQTPAPASETAHRELVKVHDPIPTHDIVPDHFEWASFDRASRFPCSDLGPDALQQQALLADTDNFYVVPDQFGVVSGHLLVLPKQRASSIASLPANLDDEFTWLLGSVSGTVAAEYDAQVIISEHGECGCATADQAHVHVIPIPRDVSREHLITAINRALRRRMVGVSSVAYKDTVFTSVEDMRELFTHPLAATNGKGTQYDDLCQAGRYPASARSVTGVARPYVYVKAPGVEFTSMLSFKSQFVREVVADVAGLPEGAWDRRVHVDRSNMFDTFRRLVGPLAITDRRRYGFRARAGRHERDCVQSVTRASTMAIS